jgi:hypothetical protein
MSYSYDKFLRPITTTDKNIQIIDNTGIVKYTINPFSVINVMVSNNLLKINMKQGRVILINFSTTAESKLAISRIQEQLDILREKTPLLIDKQIESYFSGIDTNLIPSIDSVYDLGSTSSQWRSLHVSSNTIYLGGVTISATGSSLLVNGYPVGDFNFTNGLSQFGQTVSLGGTLSNTLQLSGNSQDFIATGFDNITFTSSVFDVFSDFISLDSTDLTLNAGGQLSLSGDSGLVSIGNTQGLVYQSDYSLGFVTQSLVDKGYVDTLIADITISDENTIYVRKQGGDFLTIKEAVDSITTASSSNTYVVKVGGGVYQEQPIQMKSYVSVVGESSVSTIIEAIDPNSTLIIGADQSIIADCQIQGCTGFEVAAVEYSSTTTPQRDAIFYVENVRFGENYTHARVIGTTSGPTAGNCIMQCSNVKYGGYPFTVGFHVTGSKTTVLDGVSRMQLRNVTSTNGGIETTPDLIFALSDSPGCGFVVNGCLLTKSVGTASGTGFQVENGGFLRLTGVNFQRWDKGIYAPDDAGTPSIDAIALNFENNTTDVKIDNTKAIGKIQGSDNYLKTIISTTASLYEVNKDPRTITVAKKGGDFKSLSSAVNSITDSGEYNRYVIKVGPGRYTENEINLVDKPYVSIVGSDIQTTTIEPNSDTHSVFILGDTNELSFMTIQGAGPGYAGIECTDIGESAVAGFSLVHKISMYNCDTMILVKSTSPNNPVEFFGEYLDINGTYTWGIKVESGLGCSSFVNLENFYAVPSSEDSISNYVSGDGAELVIQGGSIQSVDFAIGNSTGVYLEDSAKLTLVSIDIMDQDKALHVGATGGASTFECSAVIIRDCLADMLIEHTNASGVFQGIASHGKITNYSTNTTPGVAWAFLDSSDGEFDITKRISVTFDDGTHTDLSSIIFNGSPMGTITGSTLSVVSGLTVSISNGIGYIQGTSGPGIVKNIEYTDTPGYLYFSVPDNSSEYVYLNDEVVNIYSSVESRYTWTGVSSSLPDTEQNIMLGRVVTSDGEVVFIDRSPITSKHQSNKNTNFIRQAIGSVYEYGSNVESSLTPFELNVASGSYFFGNTNFKPSGGDSITFKEFYSDGSVLGWTITSPTSTVNNTQWDSGDTTLTTLTSGYFTKHSLYVVSDGPEEQYLLVIGQEEYPTQLDAELGSIPTPPNYFIEGVTLLASIYIKEGESDISQIEDLRNLGFKSSVRSSDFDKVRSGQLPNLTINGLTELSQTIEVINLQPTGATAATVTYDFSGGSIFYHGTASTNFTADFINIPTKNNRAITTTIILSQGPTAYVPNVVQIEGVTQSVKWGGGTYSGTANGVDIIGFTFIRSGSDWAQVLGQINTFS